MPAATAARPASPARSWAFALATCVLFTAGCTVTSRHSTQSPGPSTSSILAVPAPTASAAATAISSASASASPVLPAGCPALLPLGTVEQILGVGLLGQVTYLRAAPVPKSGRTGRVTCGYGTPTKTQAGSTTASPTLVAAGTPLVQVSYITYVDAKTAADRVATTVQADGASATISKVSVGGLPAEVLVGPQWNELVMADGARTIVVEASPVVLAADKAAAALSALAVVMLRFGKPVVASATPAATASASSS